MRYLSVIVLLLLLSCKVKQDETPGFLKAHEKAIVNAQGENIILRGMGLGGWMLQEGYMLQIRDQGMQHKIKARITDLVGEEKCDAFYSLWLQNHTTKTDIDSMASWGFNSIRLPMHYNLFTLPIEEEPVEGENTWIGKGFDMVDSLLSWCKANQMYLILDLHAAPGGQGNDANISDYDATKPSLWESELNKKKTVALWRKIAERYANESFIGGYDLINEPNWSFEGKDQHGREDTLNQPIWNLYKEITLAIREVDKNHIIFLGGNGWGNNYRGFPGPWDDNMALSFHKYWNPNEPQDISFILELREKYNMPVWLGESGENTNKWFTDCIRLMEQHNIGWAWWPLKKIRNVVCPLTIPAPQEYDLLLNYWHGSGDRPDTNLAEKVLFEIADNLKIENNRFNPDVIDAMFRQVSESGTLPYKKHNLPGRIYATDFDLGYLNHAYFDADSERTGRPGQTAGNKGYQYRNDGVDIEKCDDFHEHTNGYNIFEIDPGEWLQYSAEVQSETTQYHVFMRIASQNKHEMITLMVNEVQVLENVVLNLSGINWQTVSLGTISMKGKVKIKLLFPKGGFKVGYLEFLPA